MVRPGSLFASALVAVVTACGLTAATAGGQPARLAFQSDYSIFTMNADGSGRVRLVHGHPSYEGWPKYFGLEWSPDGSSIAFTSEDRHYRNRVHVMDADGRHRHTVGPDPGPQVDDFFAGWTPEGRMLFNEFSYRTRRTTFYSVDPSGRRLREVPRALREYGLEYSPDRSKILFARYRTTSDEVFSYPDLWVMNADGSHKRRIYRDGGSGVWSPDGRRIAFASIQDRNGLSCSGDYCDWHGEIYVMDADGHHRVRLTYSGGDDWTPSWSPDGTRIAYQSDRNYPTTEHPEIYSIRPDGSCMTWLTNGSAESQEPVWQPGLGGDASPGACGDTGRKPLIHVSLGLARRAKHFPLYWFGPKAPDGMIAGSASDWGPNRFGVSYDDCGLFIAVQCGLPVEVENYWTCTVDSENYGAGLLDYKGVAAHLRLLDGLLVADWRRRERATAYLGPTTVAVDRFGKALDDALGRLRLLDGTKPASLPGTAFSDSFWRKLRRVERSYARTHDSEATARNLGLERYQVDARLELAQRLRELGVDGRLACPP